MVRRRIRATRSAFRSGALASCALPAGMLTSLSDGHQLCCAYLCRKLLYYSYFKQATEGDVQVCCGGDAMPSARSVYASACITQAAAICVMRTFLGNPVSPAAAPHWMNCGKLLPAGLPAVGGEAGGAGQVGRLERGQGHQLGGCQAPGCLQLTCSCHDYAVHAAFSPSCMATQRLDCVM